MVAMEVNKTMAIDGVPYIVAKRAIEKKELTSAPVKDLHNFPALREQGKFQRNVTNLSSSAFSLEFTSCYGPRISKTQQGSGG